MRATSRAANRRCEKPMVRRRPVAYSSSCENQHERRSQTKSGGLIPFRSGFASGSLPMLFGRGSTFVGGTNRGWGSRGRSALLAPADGLDRQWSLRGPRTSKPGHGFRVSYSTSAGDSKTARTGLVTSLGTHPTYIQSATGSPEVDRPVHGEKATVAADGLSVRWRRPPLRRGHVHTITFSEPIGEDKPLFFVATEAITP